MRERLSATVRLSTKGWLLDMMEGERQLLKRLADAREVGRGLLNERQAQRQARATLVRYREEMGKRFLPLLDDITDIFEGRRYGHGPGPPWIGSPPRTSSASLRNRDAPEVTTASVIKAIPYGEGVTIATVTRWSRA